jgi:hypothetical protein
MYVLIQIYVDLWLNSKVSDSAHGYLSLDIVLFDHK